MTPAEAVAALDAIDLRYPEAAHIEAEDILLDLVPLEVREAHQRLVDNCAWWAFA